MLSSCRVYVEAHRRVAFLPFARITLKSLISKPWYFEPQTLGEHIKRRRLQLGLYQKDVAAVIGVSTETVFNWEKGLNNPEIQYMPSIITFIGYDPEPPKPTNIAEYIKAKRRELGWTQERLAYHLGVDPCTITDWEAGKTILFKAHRKKVATFIGLCESEIDREMKRLWNIQH